MRTVTVTYTAASGQQVTGTYQVDEPAEPEAPSEA